MYRNYLSVQVLLEGILRDMQLLCLYVMSVGPVSANALVATVDQCLSYSVQQEMIGTVFGDGEGTA